MVSSLGYQLGKNKVISGFGVRRGTRKVCYTRKTTRGTGIARSALGGIISHVGHALVNKIAGVVRGSGVTGGSWKVTGSGRKKAIRRPRTLLRVRRTIQKPIAITTIGGYKRRTRRRAPRRLIF